MVRAPKLSMLLALLLSSAACVAQQPPGAAIPLSQVQLDESMLRVHFIDIGPGLAMLIETPSGLHYFVDGGMWGLADMQRYVEHFVPTTEPIDVVIVTHADFDHYKGAHRIFQAYEVHEFWYTGYDSPELAPSWREFLRAVEDEDGCTNYTPLNKWVDVGAFETIDDGNTPADDTDDVVVQYLNIDSNPPAVDPISGRHFNEAQRRNNASLVFKLIYGDVSFLITGDINGRDIDHKDPSTDDEIDSEELELWTRHKLSPDFSLQATVLQVPHHGSNGSVSTRFVQAVDPTWAVIPAGHQVRFNHPSPHALRRLVAAGVDPDFILRTDEGDSTPETRTLKDPRGDDCYIFETDGTVITRVLRVRID